MSDKNERMIELKACPFCGGEAKYGNKGRNWIVCENCRIETAYFNQTEDAIECWNTRKPIERIIEQLEEEVSKTNKIYHEKVKMNDIGINATLQGNMHGFEVAIDMLKKEEVLEMNEKIGIEKLDLSVRTSNCLKRAGVFTVEDLCKKTKLDVMRIRNLGAKSVQELLDVMKENGLEFREE